MIFFNGIDRLGQAAAPPVYTEFELVELLDRVIASEKGDANVLVEMAGVRPFVLLGSTELIEIIISNAIRNAIEATEGIKSSDAVVVNWGETDRDYWIAILDRGPGFPHGFSKAFDIGSTTKRNHLGMGLALASQAASSMNGRVTLAPREPTGVKFELRWTHTTNENSHS